MAHGLWIMMGILIVGVSGVAAYLVLQMDAAPVPEPEPTPRRGANVPTDGTVHGPELPPRPALGVRLIGAPFAVASPGDTFKVTFQWPHGEDDGVVLLAFSLPERYELLNVTVAGTAPLAVHTPGAAPTYCESNVTEERPFHVAEVRGRSAAVDWEMLSLDVRAPDPVAGEILYLKALPRENSGITAVHPCEVVRIPIRAR